MNQHKAITSRLNSLVGINKPKGRNEFKNKTMGKVKKILETTRNNVLLAEFLNMLTTNSEGNIKEDVNSFKFNSDWNWLMEVVEKIEETNLGSLEIQSKNLVLLQYNQKTDMHYSGTLIENLYNACIQFVEWYNENKTKR